MNYLNYRFTNVAIGDLDPPPNNGKNNTSQSKRRKKRRTLCTGQSDDKYKDAYGNRYAIQMMMSSTTSSLRNEAMVPQPGMVTFQVTVNAALTLK